MTIQFVFVLLKLKNQRARVVSKVKRSHGKYIHHQRFDFDHNKYLIFVFQEDPQKDFDQELQDLRNQLANDAEIIQWKDEFQYYAFVKPEPRQNLNYHQQTGDFMVLEDKTLSSVLPKKFGFNIVMCLDMVNVPQERLNFFFKDQIIFDFQSLGDRFDESTNKLPQKNDIFTVSMKRKENHLKKRKHSSLNGVNKRLSFGMEGTVHIINGIKNGEANVENNSKLSQESLGIEEPDQSDSSFDTNDSVKSQQKKKRKTCIKKRDIKSKRKLPARIAHDVNYETKNQVSDVPAVQKTSTSSKIVVNSSTSDETEKNNTNITNTAENSEKDDESIVPNQYRGSNNVLSSNSVWKRMLNLFGYAPTEYYENVEK